ncbi:MAG: hypothetical protein LUQ23_01165 [Methanomicrobiales archaeon]|nr:hypothetical protein [Methanomicrobiales archaeon]MDD1671124.1 hypothetical protein [Methanomicrobiales archaeon]
MRQHNLQPWASASDVMNAVNEIAAIADENRGIPKVKIEHYGILAVISDLEFKHQFLRMLEERCPVAHPQFVRYLHKLAENGRKYSREYRSDMHHMTNHMGRLYGMYGNGIFSRMKRGRRVSDSARDDAVMNFA